MAEPTGGAGTGSGPTGQGAGNRPGNGQGAGSVNVSGPGGQFLAAIESLAERDARRDRVARKRAAAEGRPRVCLRVGYGVSLIDHRPTTTRESRRGAQSRADGLALPVGEDESERRY